MMYLVDKNGNKLYLTLAGKKQERSKAKYPYSYSRFAIWNSGEWSENDRLVYSDRLRNQYPDTYENLKSEILGYGDYFSNYEPEDIEKFLCALWGRKIKLTGIEEECNASNGYPYWLLYYREEK